ncbi:hypothetical protein [Gelatiniphilus marinus]|uniref:Tetratricopeptide repeat protein n=1 Tax=Gelatiniphilus marinus TaxID=1759464 RepID=A0ABW5JSG2_9FLAO
MKHLLILPLLFFSLNGYSQNYKENYKADICACLETKKNTLQTANKIFDACFAKQMTTYASLIEAEIKEEDKTQKFIVGQKIRRELHQKLKYELVYSCNAYFDIIEQKKQDVLQQYRSKKIDSTRIERLNESVAMQPHYSNYFNRGQFYYFIGDLKKAEQDVKKSIQENPLSQSHLATAQESLLLAMIYEEQKKYSEAIAIYDTINSKTINPSVALLRAIVFRKSNGYALKPKVPVENNNSTSASNSKPAEKAKNKPANTSRTRTAQTNRNRARAKKEQNRTINRAKQKPKDSTKPLRGLFKLDG